MKYVSVHVPSFQSVEEQVCGMNFSSRAILHIPYSLRVSFAHIHFSLSPTGGDGRFGKMYECHNVETGERMVVKEISIQERDRYRVQKAILERTTPLKTLDHPNVLKFIGVEFHDVSGTLL